MSYPKTTSARVLRAIVLDPNASVELRLRALEQFLPSRNLLKRLIQPDQPAAIRFQAWKKYDVAVTAAKLMNEDK